jgi:invasion protein IalB
MMLVTAVCATLVCFASWPSRAETFGDWELSCHDDGATCALAQSLIDDQSQTRVMHASVIRNSDANQFILNLTLPLGILLEPGIEIRIGDSFRASGIPVDHCELDGCVVEALMADDLVRAMRENASAQIIATDANRQAAALPLSLTGFDEGVNSFSD